METLRGMGNTVAEYVGVGQGESSTTEALVPVDVDAAEPGLDDQSHNDEVFSSDGCRPSSDFLQLRDDRLEHLQ